MNEEEMLASINPNTHLDDAFLRSMYCEGMSNPDFPEKAIQALEAAGHSKARAVYEEWVRQYETEREAMLKRVAHWYAKETKEFYERWVREKRRQQKVDKQERRAKEAIAASTKYQFTGFPEDW